MVKIIIKRDENEKKNLLHPGDQESGKPFSFRFEQNMIKVVEMAKYHQYSWTMDVAVIVDLWQDIPWSVDIDRRHGHS